MVKKLTDTQRKFLEKPIWSVPPINLWTIALLKKMAPRFRYDERNPFRRYCKECGQQQEYHQRSWGGHGWWEDMGNIINPECGCHMHSTDTW